MPARSRDTGGTSPPRTQTIRPFMDSAAPEYWGAPLSVGQIANDIGMARQNVEHDTRFKDQMKVTADRQKRLRLVSKED
jgi:hypothetical protein